MTEFLCVGPAGSAVDGDFPLFTGNRLGRFMEAGSLESVAMKRMNYKDTELFGMLSSWVTLALLLGVVVLLAAR